MKIEDFSVIAGREIGVFGRRVRGPITLLTRHPSFVRSHEHETRGIVAHPWADSAGNSGTWFEREFRSHCEASAFAAALRNAFAGKTMAEAIDHRSGRPAHAQAR